MHALLAALALAVAVPAPSGIGSTVVAAKKKPKKKADSKEKEQPAETSEGLDLTAPIAPQSTPESTIEGPPADAPPTVTETAPPPASTATAGTWSIVSPRTAGNGGNLLEAGAGYPGVHAAFTHGLSDSFDLGARVDLNYDGYQTLVGPPMFGFSLAAQLKLRFFSGEKLSAGLVVKPGLLVYFPPGGRPAHAGLQLPISANLGYALSDKLNLGVFVELPLFGLFGVSAVFPLMAGVGAEYFVSGNLAVYLAVKAGPAFWTNGAPMSFSLDATAGIGFHL